MRRPFLHDGREYELVACEVNGICYGRAFRNGRAEVCLQAAMYRLVEIAQLNGREPEELALLFMEAEIITMANNARDRRSDLATFQDARDNLIKRIERMEAGRERNEIAERIAQIEMLIEHESRSPDQG